MPQLTLFLIGDYSRPDFSGVGEFLDSLGRTVRYRDVEAASLALNSGDIADLIVVAQAYPGEYSQAAIDRLRVVSPLSRTIALLGSWCEGEMRSGQPWPTVLRIYWHQAFPRLGREVRRLAAGDCTSWGLPLTATEEERLLTESRTDFQSVIKSGTNFQSVVNGTKDSLSSSLIGIASKKRESFEWLSSLCREQGYFTLWLRGPRYPVAEGLSTILFDGTDFRGAEFDALQKLVLRYPNSRRIALMDFPRIEDRDRLIKAGAVTVISKPMNVEELYEAVEAGR
jgi:hypothetical protein